MITSGVCRGFTTCFLGTNEDRSRPLTARIASAVILCVLITGTAGNGQEKSEQSDLQWEDYAEVYTDRYIEPYEHLKLGKLGKVRSRLLALYAMGRSYEERKELDKAITVYREVLDLAPEFGVLARKVGILLAQSGKPIEGRKVLEDSLEKNPDSPLAYTVLSEYLATFLGRSPENRRRSVELAEQAVEKFPGNTEVYEHIVKVYLIARQPEKAQAVMDKAIKREDPDPFYWLRVAETAKRVWPVSTKSGAEPVRINGIYEKALLRAPNNPVILEKVADHYRDSRQSEKALEIYERLIAKNPDRLDLRKSIANVYAAMGKNEERIKTLEEIVQINPQDVDTHKELGRIYQAREDKESAVRHLKKALQLTQGSVDDYYSLSVLMLETEQAEEAARLLERASYLFPTEPIMPIMLTHAYSMLDQYEEASTQFERAADLASQTRPDMLNERFYFRYGAAVERAGDIDRAADLFRKSMDLLSKSNTSGREDEQTTRFRATLYNYLGYMWVENDMNLDEGGALIQQAAELDPTSGAIADSLAWFYFKKERYEDAKREMKRALELVEESDAVLHDHMGQIHFKLDELEEAVEEMKQAVELDPEKEEFQERLEEYEKALAKKQPDPDAPKETEAEEEKSDSEKPGSDESDQLDAA